MTSNDVLPNHASYAMVRKDMLEPGIELFELRPDAESYLKILGGKEYCNEDRCTTLFYVRGKPLEKYIKGDQYFSR